MGTHTYTQNKTLKNKRVKSVLWSLRKLSASLGLAAACREALNIREAASMCQQKKTGEGREEEREEDEEEEAGLCASQPIP